MGKNDFTLKAIMGTILALLLSVGIFLAANMVLDFKRLGPRPETMEFMQDILMVHALLSFTMLVLSLYLVFIYLRDYLQLKSPFTLGLLIAVFSFMLFAIAANPLLHIFFDVYGGKGVFSIVPYLFATISLAILVWISSK